MPRLIRHTLTAAALASLAASSPALAQTPAGLVPVETFSAPIAATAPPGDGRRLHVVERGGVIRVVRDGVKLAQPFLDISAEVDTTGEGGLLSLAFAPDYRLSGYFYVYLTPKDVNPGVPPFAPIEVREYRRSALDPDRADPASGRTVLTIPHPTNANHYGGGLRFGPDGLLYAGTGDGGGGGDPQRNAQNAASRLGKLLRLDPRPDGSAADGSAAYRVPADNPFVGTAGDDLIWSLGLRNPFRFSFDRLTGDLTIADVGQNAHEEVDFVPASQRRGRGANFGWNDCEGPAAYPATVPPTPCPLASVLPVYSYTHVTDNCNSITGGVVVRDPGLEALLGRYVYGDFCRGFANSLQLALPAAGAPQSLGLNVASVADFAEDACGRVHVVQLGTGVVSRLEDSTPSACALTATYPPPTDPPGTGTNPPLPVGPSARPPAAKPLPSLRLSLGGALRQRALARGEVRVRARCNRDCALRALGRLSLKTRGRPIRLREARRSRLAANRAVTLRLRLTRGGRAALRRALRSRRPVRARVTVRARDSSGRLVTSGRTIRLVR